MNVKIFVTILVTLIEASSVRPTKLDGNWLNNNWRNAHSMVHRGPLPPRLPTTPPLVEKPPQKETIRVGLLMPRTTAQSGQRKVTFGNSVGAISMALERIETEQLLPGINFSFVWHFDKCDEVTVAGHLVEMVKHENVSVMIEPICYSGAVVASIVLKRYFAPRLGWAAMSSELSNKTRFAGRTSSIGSPVRMSRAIMELLIHYNWRRIAMIYANDAMSSQCHSIAEHLQKLLPSADIVNVHNLAVETSEIPDVDMENFLNLFVQTARIAIVCFETESDLDRFMSFAQQRGLTSNDYVYIILDYIRDSSADELRFSHSNFGFESAEYRHDSKKAFRKALFVEMATPSSDTLRYFKREVIRRAKLWPFFYDSSHPDDQYGSSYSPFLHDVFYLYALALNRTLRRGGSIKEHIMIINSTRNIKFNGWSGKVEIGENGERKTSFVVSGYDKDMHLVPFAEITLDSSDGHTVHPLASDHTIAEVREGPLPSDIPECGFRNEKCDSDFAYSLRFTITAIIFGCIVFFALVIFGMYKIQRRIFVSKMAKMTWRIDYRDIDWMDHSKQRGSISWGHPQTKLADDEADETNEKESSQGRVVQYKNSVAWAKTHLVGAVTFSNRSDMLHLGVMREMKHENINPFIGLCVDLQHPISLWGYASNGSLRDVIQNGTVKLDAFFKYLLIKDLANAMEYLHSTSIISHGRLRSSNCLIDNRWVLKVTDYGLHKIQAPKTTLRDKLWTAPELLRLALPPPAGTQKGDVFSFAIIIQEIVLRDKPYALDQIVEDEIIFRLRNLEMPPFRPTILGGAKENDTDEGILQLMRDCWHENAQLRPDFKAIKSILRQLAKGRSTNLMDHVLKTMEKYATTLEEIVADRMKQLAEETKKTDQLLCRLLPRAVAVKLKSGQTVEAECFECATILFSDVVGFTQIAARSSPMEIVTLLNELYTLFDDIIAMYDVYKVVTIGDGYMCASGLPTRNGNRHASEMADMSLHVISALKTFNIPHILHEKLEVRIGMHTGPVVAGIVGLTMPRYCVFGDTVNTASRLEGSGQASSVHISDVTNGYLTEIIGGYITKPRGEIIIKGRGVIFTHWLLGKTGRSKVLISHHADTFNRQEGTSKGHTVNLAPVESIE